MLLDSKQSRPSREIPPPKSEAVLFATVESIIFTGLSKKIEDIKYVVLDTECS